MTDGDPVMHELDARLRAGEAERDARSAERDRIESEIRELRTTPRAAAREWRKRRVSTIVLLTTTLATLAGAFLFYRWDHAQLEATHYEGHVVSVAGDAPVARGDACAIDVVPNVVPNARASVTCGGLRLYGFGSFGRVSCEASGRRPSACVDTDGIASDGDPQLELLFGSKRAIVADGAWRIVIEIGRTAASP